MYEAEIDNALVRQKDRLLTDLNNHAQSGNLDEIQRILDQLDFNLELWCCLRYGYKAIEIGQRIKSVLQEWLNFASMRRSTRKARILRMQGECDMIVSDVCAYNHELLSKTPACSMS